MVVSLFPKGIQLNIRFLVVALFSVTLMIVDHQTPYFTFFRQGVLTVLSPVVYVTILPVKWVREAQQFWSDRSELIRERSALLAQNQLLQVQLQQSDAIQSENNRLRALLHAAPRASETVLVADVIGFNPDPFVHELTLNKGQAQGVFVGQVVLDAKGLVGQVTEVAWQTAVVLLVTDAAHALPIENKRTRARGILSGTGRSEMTLLYVTSTADVAVGDLLLTSALGGRFPAGYPVGIVEQIVPNEGGPFLKVKVRPVADLDKAHELLLIHANTGEENIKP